MFLYFDNMTTNTVLGEDRYLLEILLAANKIDIMKRWHTIEPPSQDGWLKIVTDIYDMEVLIHIKRAQEEQCPEKLEKWMMFTSQQ